MNSNKEIDALLAQLGCKPLEGPQEEVGQDGNIVNYVEDEDYVNFVLREIIQGNESIEPEENTQSKTTQPSDTAQQQPDPSGGVATTQPSAFSSQTSSSSSNVLPLTASYLANGQQVILFPTTTATAQATAVAFESAATQINDKLEGKKVALQTINYLDAQNVLIPATATLVTHHPQVSNASNSPSAVVQIPSVSTNPTVSQRGASETSSVSQDSAAISAAEMKKKKLYEEGEFDDPNMEKRRKNAQNAKNHREKTKRKIQDLTEELDKVQKEKEESQAEVKRLKIENGESQAEVQRLKAENVQLNESNAQREELLREIQTLRQENEMLKAKEQAMVQQQKLGFDDLFNDFF